MPRFFHREEIRFTAAHRYEQARFSDEENALTFGPCYNPDGHGHDYRLVAEIELRDAGDRASIHALQEALWQIHELVDHRHLNHHLPRFQSAKVVPTTENLTQFLFDELKTRAPQTQITWLRLYERPDLYSELRPP